MRCLATHQMNAILMVLATVLMPPIKVFQNGVHGCGSTPWRLLSWLVGGLRGSPHPRYIGSCYEVAPRLLRAGTR